MPASRRGSGSVTLPSGQTLAIHTRTQDEEDLPHATKKYVLLFATLLLLIFFFGMLVKLMCGVFPPFV